MSFYSCRRNVEKCVNCGFCSELVICPATGRKRGLGGAYEGGCIDCQVCYQACPYQAVERVVDRAPRKNVRINIDGEMFSVPERITIKKALENLGYKFSKLPTGRGIPAPCELGGCYACALYIEGELKPACTTPVSEGLEIQLKLPRGLAPLRRVSGFQPHSVGGVGTPWWIKKSGQYFIEVACFTHGCNLRCPQCQNFTVTYDNAEPPSPPKEAAETLTAHRHRYHVDRMAISGGEPTLNREWLIEFFRELARLNRDPNARLHLDTNATVLTPGYIDELVEVGVTDVGPDLKGLHVETFMRITGIADEKLAKTYLETAWNAAKYLIDEYYPEKLFVGIGVPYNKYFITLDEIREIGDRLAEINSEVQVCLLDYFPTFRRLDMTRPTVGEMRRARTVLKESGLKIVLAQTVIGHLGP